MGNYAVLFYFLFLVYGVCNIHRIPKQNGGIVMILNAMDKFMSVLVRVVWYAVAIVVSMVFAYYIASLYPHPYNIIIFVIIFGLTVLLNVLWVAVTSVYFF